MINIDSRIRILDNTPILRNGSNSTVPTNQGEDRKKLAQDAGNAMGFFFLFLVLVIYVVSKLTVYRNRDDVKQIKDKIWRFLIIANVGFFLETVVLCLYHKFSYAEFEGGYILGMISLGFFVFGIILSLRQMNTYCKEDPNFLATFYSFDLLVKPLYTLPFDSVRVIVLFSDNCCQTETTTIYEYKGDLYEHTSCCACTWNICVVILKWVTLIVSIIYYYASLLLITVFLVIIILIFRSCCKKPENVITQEENSQVSTPLTSNENYQQPEQQYNNQPPEPQYNNQPPEPQYNNQLPTYIPPSQ